MLLQSTTLARGWKPSAHASVAEQSFLVQDPFGGGGLSKKLALRLKLSLDGDFLTP